ncbi:MAG: BrxA family protein, partial [Lentisphaeria bacterium]
LVNQRNEFNLRTERSRSRIAREIQKGFLQFRNEEHQTLIREVFKARVPLQDKELVLIWQLTLNNRLFREITSRVFVKTYYSGRVSICKDDIAAYLKEFLCQKESLQISWSENTINTLSSKYLNLMSKLGFLNAGRIKAFKHVRPSSEAQVLFLYLAKIFSPNTSNILTNALLPVSFIPLADVHERFKKLSLKGFFNMNFNGVALNIELTHSYKGIFDVLYH